MLGRVVDYLRNHGISFRLSSRPSPERLPAVAQPLHPGTVVLECHVVRVAGRPAVACIPRGTKLNLQRLRHELGAEVALGDAGDLPDPYTGAAGPIPPLGGDMGTLTLVDEAVITASQIAFPAFSDTDLVEIPYDEFARLERPRVASFAGGGELPETGEPERKSA